MSSARPSPWEHLVLTRRSACFPEWAALPPCFQALTFVGFRILSFSPQRFYFRERVCACVAGGRRGRGRERPAAVSLEEPDLQLSPAPREAVTVASITGRTPSPQSHPGAPCFYLWREDPNPAHSPYLSAPAVCEVTTDLAAAVLTVSPLPWARAPSAAWLAPRPGSLGPQSDSGPGPWPCLCWDRLCR